MAIVAEFGKPEYPGFLNPCNGCGLCCIAEQCPMSLDFFGEQHRCPALVNLGPVYGCDLMQNPMPYVEAADPAKIDRWMPTGAEEFPDVVRSHLRLRMGIGRGCDAEFEEI